MEKRNTISVVIPMYNSVDSIEVCVKSVLNAAVDQTEIIIVDDGSTDGSVELCEKEFGNSSNITIIKNKHAGVSNARNTGLKAAVGDYILFVDADDEVDSCYVKKLYGLILEADMAFCGFYINYKRDRSDLERIQIDTNEESYVKSTREVVIELEKRCILNSCCNKIYRKEIIYENNIFFSEDMNRGEDLKFNCDYLKQTQKIAYTNQCLYFYNRFEDSSLSHYDPLLINNLKTILNIRKELNESLNMKDHAAVETVKICNAYDVAATVHNLYKRDAELTSGQRYKLLKKIVTDDTIMENLECEIPNESRIFYITRKILRTKNPTWILISFNILFKLRYTFNGFYLRIRNSFLFKSIKSKN